MTENTLLRPVYWEPVDGTGERLMVGAVVWRDEQSTWHRMIRDDVLDCLYGKAAVGLRTMIDTGLQTLNDMAKVAGNDDLPPVFGLTPGESRPIHSESLADAFRICALMYSSLSTLDNLDDNDDTSAPNQDESNRRFSTEVRAIVIDRRPELDRYFGLSAPLVEGGKKTRFGFCSQRALVHFGVLHPVRQLSSVRDARARLWELYRARELSGINFAALIFAAPRQDDPTLSARQVANLLTNLDEIEREADTYNMRFLPVTTAAEGADRVIEYA